MLVLRAFGRGVGSAHARRAPVATTRACVALLRCVCPPDVTMETQGTGVASLCREGSLEKACSDLVDPTPVL